jgi:hypothetical protein
MKHGLNRVRKQVTSAILPTHFYPLQVCVHGA